jgi:hypothetical protein
VDSFGVATQSLRPYRKLQMTSQTAQSASDVDVGQLMEVICGFRKEVYPFEKYTALVTFSTWLRWHQHPDVVDIAGVVAAAHVILAIEDGEIKVPKGRRQIITDKIVEMEFTVLRAADALVTCCRLDSFEKASEQSAGWLSNVSQIVRFMIKCPAKQKPSLNKAFFFIDEGGFGDDMTIYSRGEERPYKVSPASLRSDWSNFAISGPFVLAAEHLDMEAILHLPPDSNESIADATKLLSSPAKLRTYFGLARHVQELLLQRLDKTSRERFPFVKFPDAITTHVVEPQPLTADQMAIVDRYRAPKWAADPQQQKPRQGRPRLPYPRPSGGWIG